MFHMRFICTSIVFALLSFPVIAWSWFDHINGGNGWRQGDWLINFGDGQIRRGLVGELLIFTSDSTGIGLLATTQIVQVLFFVATVFVLWQIALRYSTPLLILLLGMAPAGFLTFFAANPTGSMRKEVFGVLALGLLVLSSLTTKRTIVVPVIALAVYIIGCIGNVLHCLMFPIFIMGFYFLRKQDRLSRASFGALTGITILSAVFWLAYGITFRGISDLAPICAPLLERGLDAEICSGAIRWLVTGEVDHGAELVQRLTLAAVMEYAFVAVLSLIPLWIASRVFAERGLLVFVVVVCFVPLLPLYVTATDWSRWLSLSYTATALLLIQGHAAKQFTVVQLPSRALVAGYICAALFIAPEHSLGWKLGGAAREVVQHILIFV